MKKKLEKILVALLTMLLRALIVMWGYSAIAWDFNLPFLSYWQILLATWAIRCLCGRVKGE